MRGVSTFILLSIVKEYLKVIAFRFPFPMNYILYFYELKICSNIIFLYVIPLENPLRPQVENTCSNGVEQFIQRSDYKKRQNTINPVSKKYISNVSNSAFFI